MEKKFIIPKGVRIACYILLFFIGLFACAAIYVNVYLDKKVIEFLEQRVSESTHGEYALSVDNFTVQLLAQNIVITNLVVAPTGKAAPGRVQYVFKAATIKFIGFSIFSYLKNNNLMINRVEVEKPEISIFQGKERLQNKISDIDAPRFSIYAMFSKKLNSVSIGQIDIINSRFTIYKSSTDTLPVFCTNENTMSIKNFNINALTDKNKSLFDAEKMEMVMNKFSYHLDNGLYTMYGNSLHVSYLDSLLTIDSLQLVPIFSKKEFATEAGRQVSRVKIIAAKVEMQKMDVKLFFEYNWLVIHKVELDGCLIDVFRDNTLALAPIVRPSVQAMIKDLPFFVKIDTVEMKNGETVFQMRNPGQDMAGKITVTNMNVTITGVQNDTTLYSDKSSIIAKVTGKLLNESKFNLNYIFPLKARKEFFYCSGSLAAMDMTVFNPLTQNVKHLLIKSGKLDSASFAFTAGEFTSSGTMKVIYHDLDVEVMNKEGETSKLKEKIRTMVVNALIVKDSNPGKDNVVRISPIHAEHNPYRFFMNYSVQSILSGIAPSMVNEKRVRMFKKNK